MELTHQERIAQDYHIHQFELMHDTKQKLFEKGVGVSYQDLLRFRMCCDTRDLIQELHNISISLNTICAYMEKKK